MALNKTAHVNLMAMRVRIKAPVVGLVCALYLISVIGLGLYPLRATAALTPQTPASGHFGYLHKSSNAYLRALENARLRNLCGRIVENRDGQKLGKLQDFVVDIPSGHVIYALVSSGHGVGPKRHLKILPPQVLSTATAKKGVLQLDIAYARWQHAPRFKMPDLDAVSGPEPKAQIYAYYGQSVNKNNRGELLEFASAIVGKQVANRQRELLGHFSDLLVDVTGQRTVLAIAVPVGQVTQNESLAVPLCRLRPTGDPHLWVLDASRKMLAEAPVLDEQSWQKASIKGPGTIYRFPDGAYGDGGNRSAVEASKHACRLYPYVAFCLY